MLKAIIIPPFIGGPSDKDREALEAKMEEFAKKRSFVPKRGFLADLEFKLVNGSLVCQNKFGSKKSSNVRAVSKLPIESRSRK